MPSACDLHSITDLLVFLVGVGQQLVCTFSRNGQVFSISSSNPELRHQLLPLSGQEFGQYMWLFILPGRRDGQRYRSNCSAGNWWKLGNKEVWRRGRYIGISEGEENIKTFVFHVNDQEGLTIKQNKSPCG